MAAKFDLDAIVIASPCTVPWDSMTGNDAKRFCGQCKLHVHDFSQMTRKEIGALLEKTDGNVCKRIWRRPDGTMITKDCGRVVRALKRRLELVATAFASLFSLVGLGGCHDSGKACCEPTATPTPTQRVVTPSDEDAYADTGR